ncbi:hypothetical protein AKH20_01715 [Pelagibacteraceae bacterium GOM-A3]|nr:hypothetical protein AKH20_01715 [Pelagibacteraceae bacterium GOM-A3]
MLDFINNNSPLVICDIGASPIDKTKFIDELFNETFSQIIGFEPNKKEYDKLKTKDPNKKFYNYALGDGEDKILNICKAPGMSSFLKPNLNYLKKFHGFEEWAQIISEEKVNTKKLNEIDEKIDFLKIDVQGYEYEVLINGLEKLNNVKVIQIETSPFPLYQGEKNSSEIMRLLENSGFMLHMFNKINTRIFKPMVLANNKTLGLNHLFQLDCVMVKNFEEINKFSEEDLTKLILIMFYSFKSYDFVDYLISIMDEKYGTNILDKYRLLNKNLKIIKKY